MNGYSSHRGPSGASRFQPTQTATKHGHLEQEARGAHEPGEPLGEAPEASASYVGRRTSGRRSLLRLSSREAGAASATADPRPCASLARSGSPVAPVLGEHVVEQVVDGDGAEQAAVVVDHRGRHQVVGRQVARPPGRWWRSGRSGSIESSRTPATSVDGGSRSSRWMCATPRNRPVGVSSGWPADVDQGGQRRAELRVADVGQRVGDRRVRAEDDRLGGHHGAGGVLGVGQQAADVLGLLGLHQLAAGSRRSRRAGRRSGRRRRRATSPRGRRRPARSPGARGSRPGPPRAAPRGRRRAARRRAPATTAVRRSAGRSWIMFAASAGRISLSAAIRWVAPWASSRLGQPLDVAPLDDVGLAAAAEALGGLLDGDPAEHPVAVARLLHRDVVDGAGHAGARDA